MQTITSIGLGPRATKKQKTRRDLLETAKRHFQRRGYVATTIRDIAGDAGYTTGAFFTFWKTKDALYAEIFGHPPVTAEQGRILWQYLTLKGHDPVNILRTEAQSEAA